MLTTSRREVFTEERETLAKTNSTAVDTKILGRQSYAIDTDAKKPNSTVFGGSYFADTNKEIAVKLFGADVPVDEWKNLDESDTENFTNPDLMPTGVTMETRNGVRVNRGQNLEKVQKTYVSINRLTQKGKIALVAYTAVVLAMILVIALTAVAVNASLGNITAIQAEINKTVEEINSIYLDVEENADAYAAELGLVSTENASTAYYNPLSTREEITYNISENWFDNLCEWVSNIFGG